MNITFLIGNGFDLRVGMKTRFTDMYAGYIAQPSASDAIEKFKKMLETDAPNYKTWGDFEMAMAQKVNEFQDETSFIECLRDFKLYMASHLINEQVGFAQRMAVSPNAKARCANEVWDSIQGFYRGLIPNVRNKFVSLGIKNNPKYKFISFNYTDAFDGLLSSASGVIHIHGSLDADVVLGADNIGQVIDLPYIVTKRFERAFIKPEFNKSFDNDRVAKAENAIDNSDIICIYGMSLGKSDLSWVIRLKDWLLSDQGHHLVYFVHDETAYSKLNWDAIMDEEENRIIKILGKLCASKEEVDKIFNQIHVPVGYDIFDVDTILKAEKDQADQVNRMKAKLHERLSERPQENGSLKK